MIQTRTSILMLSLALAAGGCTMAPKYHRPVAPVADQWPIRIATTNTPSENISELRWEEFFTDEKLREVIRLALAQNRDLRIAALNVERARALYGIQRSELLPTVDATGSAIRQRIPKDLSNVGRPITTEQYSVSLGVAAWEIDLFGRLRSLKDRSLEEYFATEHARRGAQLALIASVAETYLTLAADRENLALAETTLASQRYAFALIERRHQLGLATDLDLHRARTQVDSAAGEVARFTQITAQDLNALTLLVGGPVPEELLPNALNTVAVPREIQPGIPSEVLLQRPDVLQAESLLRAANADIGAARAAFFPRISLTAAIGSASSDLSGLFKSGSGAWSYAPEIVMPIFDARTWSAHRASKVQRDLAVAEYERAIQSAFREVADALAVRSTVDAQTEAQASMVRSLEETYRLSQSRYEKGIDNYLSVLDAQRSLFAAQQQLVRLDLSRVASQVRLYAVLGGGSQVEADPTRADLSKAH